MALTDIQARTAKPGAKPYKLSDGGWLFLLVKPSGSKLWRMAYRFAGKEKLLSLGAYPQLSLKDARTKRDEAKALLVVGIDPGEHKKAGKIATAATQTNTLEQIAAELLEKKRSEGKAQATLSKFEWLLSLVAPTIRARQIDSLTPQEILALLRPIEGSGRRETARRLRAKLGEVFRYAIATGRAEIDPTGSLKGALAAPVVSHRAAIVSPVAFGALLRAISTYEGGEATKAALELLALTFVRPGELRAAAWSEFDLDAALWAIPAIRMKMRRPHRVPLAAQTVAILKELHAVTGHGKFVFPSFRSAARCMSENTVNGALRRLGFGKEEMTGHGFRSAASSMLNESGKWNPDAIEAQLAHIEANSVRKAYARAEYWDERVKMMAWWADYLDTLKAGGQVIELRKPPAKA